MGGAATITIAITQECRLAIGCVIHHNAVPCNFALFRLFRASSPLFPPVSLHPIHARASSPRARAFSLCYDGCKPGCTLNQPSHSRHETRPTHA